MKLLLSILLCSLLFLHAEPSVYDLQSGMADVKDVKKNRQLIISLKRRVAKQKEQIEGLKSVVEGLSKRLRDLSHKNSNIDSLSKLESRVDDLAQKLELLRTQGPAKPVTKKESIKNKKIDTKANSLSKIYTQGVRLFAKKRYDKAMRHFLDTDAKGYKSAASNYYLGEIAYYTKHYDDAIFYFKKSAGLYENASYMDVLLLHTAMSLERNGDKEQAKAFYQNIIENYRGKKSAKIAKKRMLRL